MKDLDLVPGAILKHVGYTCQPETIKVLAETAIAVQEIRKGFNHQNSVLKGSSRPGYMTKEVVYDGDGLQHAYTKLKELEKKLLERLAQEGLHV